MNYSKILSQVPANYYESGTKSNLLQWVWHEWKWRTLRKMLEGASGKLLDVGCADGNLTGKIKSYLPKVEVTGVDLYENALNFAKKKHKNIDFILADARKLPFKKGQFDTVVCVETLEHVPENTRAVKEIFRCLKTDGKLILIQDTDSKIFNAIWYFWTKWKGKVWDGSHVSCMNPKQLGQLLNRNGFKIIKKEYSHFGLEIAITAVKK